MGRSGSLLFIARSEPSTPAPAVHAPSAPPSAVATPPEAPVSPSVPPPPAELAELTTATSPSSAAPSSRAASARPRQDRLAQEVAILSRATSALRAGRAEEALRVLNEHQREFPNGVLGEERRAAKAQALCSLGRVAEGKAELARLAPQSVAARRAAKVCDSLPPSNR